MNQLTGRRSTPGDVVLRTSWPIRTSFRRAMCDSCYKQKPFSNDQAPELHMQERCSARDCTKPEDEDVWQFPVVTSLEAQT